MTRATLRGKSQLTLPAKVREALHVTDGDDIAFELTDDGVVMRGVARIPADQAWFWTEGWQAGEREATGDIAASRVAAFASHDEMFDAFG